MSIYLIEPATGELLHAFEPQTITTVEGQAIQADYTGPEHVHTPPPDPELGFARAWIDGAWAQVEDHRGAVVYGGEEGRQPLEITALGPRADFGTDAPAPLSAEEIAAAQLAAQEAKVEEASAEQYRRQAGSFTHTDTEAGTIQARVRAARADMDALADFGPLLEARAQPWDAQEVWFASAPGYDTIALPTEAAAKRFKLALLNHHKRYKGHLMRLTALIYAASDGDAVAAIDVTADSHWP